MIKVAGIQFHTWDKIYDFFLSEDLAVKKDDTVIVKTDLGIESGRVLDIKEKKEEDKNGLKPIIRIANLEDIQKIAQNKKNNSEILKKAKISVRASELKMKLISANCSFDGSVITITFLADGRVDFRELVKDLSAQFGRIIRLYQIGVRDCAKMIGGLGTCGREQCCSLHIDNFESITSDFVRVQQLDTRAAERVSGSCGRLLCCLAYEKDIYNELNKNFPEIGCKVKCGKCKGIVIERRLIKGTLVVKKEDGSREEIKTKDVY